MNKRLRLPLALALALGSAQALGLGLGQIEVKSGLNQPLEAEIPVVGSAGETEALQVRLASPDAFARVGLDRPATLAANLEFDVATDPRGRTVIRVSTPSDIVEPFLTFLLEVDWGRGRMLREYTVLLDSPTMAPIQGAPAATSPVVDSEPQRAEALPPPSMPEPVPAPRDTAAPPPASAPSAAPSAPAYASDSYGPVAAGETLWSIASRTRPDSEISVNQMMVALLRANPDAFIGNNINRLRSGAVLRIPGREDAVAIAAAEAAAQVRDQTQSWRDSVQPAPQPATDDSYTGLVEPDATRSTSAPDSRLELTPPSNEAGTASATQSGASAGGEGRELRADLARSREEVGTLTQENVELKSRVSELEKMQGDSSRLIELKNSELAAAQRRLAELEARAAAAEGVATIPSDTAVAASDPAASVLPADEPVATAGTDALDAAADPAASTDPAASDAMPSDSASADAVTPPMSFETPSDAAATGDGATPATDAPAAVATTPAAATPATPVPDAMPPRPEPAPWYTNWWILGGGALALIGLIALLAGRRRAAASPGAGRYDSDALAASVAAAQAGAAPAVADDVDDREGDLIEAISRDPTDLQRHLDLVRHYYDTGDAAGFESAAEAMYSRVYDPEDDAWQEVVALGQEIAPEHPLFVTTAAVAVEPDVPAPPPASVSAEREIVWDMPPAAQDTDATQPMPLAPAEPAPAPLDDFTYDSPADTYPADLGDADDSGSDAAATKLELARAYLDMGDVEGARGMLEEVLNEGNAAQRNDARRLLDEIR
ncbi:FimV/HubP family polar landmark protein [Chiayiivirga flava]|uniref:Pilus assembly protein FimV n=1 Tax=Chiayiivirga flava TaxID=659595 RepID=A0A7W8G0F0_9GAMM|nr:FimV/HubP family polar landmark protein [Chiayiivirga flava]MBB5206675.1 pilus assembly protein FimV [Chiayiivirga flava]